MKYCAYCSEPLKDSAKFCSKCGAPVEKAGTQEVQNLENDTTFDRNEVYKGKKNFASSKNKKPGMWLAIACVLVLVCGLVYGPARLFFISSQPCDWCGSNPTKAYKKSDSSYAYICKQCSETCVICKGKADKGYENQVFGTMVFLCNDCYKQLESFGF